MGAEPEAVLAGGLVEEEGALFEDCVEEELVLVLLSLAPWEIVPSG